MEAILALAHVLWIPAALALGFFLAKRRKPLTGKVIALGCLWSFLFWAGGFAALIAIGLATCKLDFR